MRSPPIPGMLVTLFYSWHGSERSPCPPFSVDAFNSVTELRFGVGGAERRTAGRAVPARG